MNEIHDKTCIIPWQESWASTFEKEREIIREAMDKAGLKCSVIHIGSTSVKDMPSKPILDILFCMEHGTPAEAYLYELSKIGYINLGECGRSGRYFLSKGDQPNETFYLHLCYPEHQVAKDQKLFRRIELLDERIFRNYVSIKKTLAELFPNDREMYRDVKGLFVEGVLSSYRLGERVTLERSRADDTDDDHVHYWIYEFNMTPDIQREFERRCKILELTPDEFFQAAVRNAIQWAEEDPEGCRKEYERCQEEAEECQDLQLIRFYPVHYGETEAQARKRKIAEEAEKGVTVCDEPYE